MMAVLYLPDFSLQAILRHTPELWATPVALLPEKTPRARLWQCTPAALAAGVAVGMTPSQGQARCPALQLKMRSEPAEACAGAALRDVAGGCSPYVEETGLGLCTVELKGRRGGAPAELAPALHARLARLELRARLGFAPTADLALLAAQSAVAPPFWRAIASPAELQDLALSALGLPAAQEEILRQWGLREIGAFLALGREPLSARLGPEVLPFYDRAAGTLARPLRCVRPPESYGEMVEFEQEVETLEPLLFMLRRLLEQITWRLEATYLVAAQLTLRLGLAQGEAYERTFKIPSPTARVEVLFRALHTHLERFTAAQPIISLHLEATPCRPARQQFGLFESALRDPNQFFETLARLAALLGHDRVGVPALEATHRPDAFHLREVELEPPPEPTAAEPAPALALRGTGALCLRRFRPPLPAQVELDRRKRPAGFSSAALHGRATAVQGPTRLSGEWWDARCWKRAEWDVELEDGTLCRLAQEQEAWFLEGVYD